MVRIALLLEYSGKNFHGSQWQLGVRTVQSELEAALSTYLRVPIRVVFAGRTDTGVHARGQVVHFDVDDSGIAGGAFDERAMCWSLNGILAKDLSVSRAMVVPGDFHARFSATQREYCYRLLNRAQRSSLLRDTHHFISYPMHLDRMKAACTALLGQHDFAGFRSTNSDRSSTICTVSRAELFTLGEGQLEFWIAADHFVYNMVRIIVGTLIEVGLGKKAPEGLAMALESGDRSLAGPTAPAWGLCLNSVKYPDNYRLFDHGSHRGAAQEIDARENLCSEG